MESKLLKNIRRIAIVGGGPTGIATAKYLVAEDHFAVIDIFEQQSSVGGVWIYDSDEPKGETEVPQTNPFQPLEGPKWHCRNAEMPEDSGVTKHPAFASPMYDGLETNIPRSLMQFSDKPFPEDEQLFPKLDSVLRYLEEYAEDVKHLVQFSTQVLDVSQKTVDDATEWSIQTKNLRSNNTTFKNYDAVVVATGHYKVPYIPNIPGIKEWNTTYLGTMSHSKFYKTANPYSNKKVLIVGYSASGADISHHISTISTHPLLISQRSPSAYTQAPTPFKTFLPEITEFLPTERAIRFANNHTESNIDTIIFCTGYLYSFPFLSSIHPPLLTTGARLHHLHTHLLYAPDPTVAFPTLPYPIIPFRTCEAQAAVLARLWSGRLALPSNAEMEHWEAHTLAAQGDGKRFHALEFPRDFDYHDELVEWAGRASGEGEGRGKVPPKWTRRDRWARSRFREIRRAFVERGDERGKVRRMEELGFEFEEGGDVSR